RGAGRVCSTHARDLEDAARARDAEVPGARLPLPAARRRRLAARPRGGRAVSELTGVVLAAGRGTRAYPYTRTIPKCMLQVDGEPNLARLLAILRDQLAIRDVVVVVGDHGEAIRERFGDGSAHGVRIT